MGLKLPLLKTPSCKFRIAKNFLLFISKVGNMGIT
jgi:hypothetical protein